MAPAPGSGVSSGGLGDLFSLSGGAGLTGGYVAPKSVSKKYVIEKCMNMQSNMFTESLGCYFPHLKDVNEYIT